jgi:transposase
MSRPTDYRPEYCEVALELARDGAGRYEIAAGLGCAYSTMQAWEKAHPEFAEAMRDAEDLSHAWWALQGRKGIWAGPGFNASAYALQVKNRFAHAWKDRHETELSGSVTLRHEDALAELE